MSEDRKEYDSDDTYEIRNARLTKDAQVFSGSGDTPLVRITFVSSSRLSNTKKTIKSAFIDAKVRDFDAGGAAFLKKGDVLGVEGKPIFEEYPEGSGKVQLKLDQARLYMSLDLKAKLKERGFTPGASGGKKAPPKARAAKPQRAVQDVDFGDEDGGS